MSRITKKEWKRGEIDFIDSNPYPERYFTIISLALAFASTILTGWSVVQSVPGWVILVKDLTIFFTLLILTLFFFVRYRMVLSSKRQLKKTLRKEITSMRELIAEQFSVYHDLMGRIRTTIFHKASEEIYPHRFNYKSDSLNKLLEKTVENTVDSMMDILKNHLSIRDPRINEKISFSIKVVVTGDMALSICKDMPEKEKNLIEKNEKYVVTLDRDQRAKLKKGREILTKAYGLNTNTAFKRLWNEETYFVENDLKQKFDKGEYKNETYEFWKKYNSTFVVPIVHVEPSNQKRTVFGFLTVDSLNESEHELFTANDTLSIMNFGADLLALVMLNIELLDRLENANGGDYANKQ